MDSDFCMYDIFAHACYWCNRGVEHPDQFKHQFMLESDEHVQKRAQEKGKRWVFEATEARFNEIGYLRVFGVGSLPSLIGGTLGGSRFVPND